MLFFYYFINYLVHLALLKEYAIKELQLPTNNVLDLRNTAGRFHTAIGKFNKANTRCSPFLSTFCWPSSTRSVRIPPFCILSNIRFVEVEIESTVTCFHFKK